jgi:hypothetical protein
MRRVGLIYEEKILMIVKRKSWIGLSGVGLVLLLLTGVLLYGFFKPSPILMKFEILNQKRVAGGFQVTVLGPKPSIFRLPGNRVHLEYIWVEYRNENDWRFCKVLGQPFVPVIPRGTPVRNDSIIPPEATQYRITAFGRMTSAKTLLRQWLDRQPKSWTNWLRPIIDKFLPFNFSFDPNDIIFIGAPLEVGAPQISQVVRGGTSR